MNPILEICCFSAESAVIAAQNGADRIELCDNYPEGGTTPSFAAIEYTIKNLKIPVNIIIRPRGGDFLYTDLEFELIKQDVLKAKELGANGVVVGFLKANGHIDLEKTAKIVTLAEGMELTFHRAFDMCSNHFKALEQLKEIGVTRILTSGAKNTVMQGLDLLAQLVQKAEGKISIMPGGDLSDSNLAEAVSKTHALEFHTAALQYFPSKMEYFNNDVCMGSLPNEEEYRKTGVNGTQVKAMKEILKKF